MDYGIGKAPPRAPAPVIIAAEGTRPWGLIPPRRLTMPIVVEGPLPEGWILLPMRRADGTVDLPFKVTRNGETTGLTLTLTREVRRHAWAFLAGAGDGAERTFGWEMEQ
ncbi:hypothetical protein GCM10007888_32870 [Methylobacterium oxalidis]|uniref:Uncharacterized protein n=1 Tax=Methylobacterium oxalidis TaxID=944322 RepID=A0ABQ6DKQ1_9HYPH|nr:hypothetical protein GCM10007888_32870 [Methylobacterium oxalidis]